MTEPVWLDDDYEESEFCECGVTLLEWEDRFCDTCAGAPHGRECPCDECEAYWARICAESAAAAERANRALVCTCGWTGAFIEHHNSTAYGPVAQAGCVMSAREPDPADLWRSAWNVDRGEWVRVRPFGGQS